MGPSNYHLLLCVHTMTVVMTVQDAERTGNSKKESVNEKQKENRRQKTEDTEDTEDKATQRLEDRLTSVSTITFRGRRV